MIMKKIVLLFLAFQVIVCTTFAYAQEDTEDPFGEYKKYIKQAKGLLNDLSVAQSHSNLASFNQSTAYIGKFPAFSVHWGLASALGSSLFDALVDGFTGQSPDEDSSSDLEEDLPAFGLSLTSLGLRFGGFGIPFDVGISGFFIPFVISSDSIFDALSAPSSELNVGLWVQQFGFDFRYAFVEETSTLPNVSVGFSYLYNRNELFAETDIEGNTSRYSMGQDTHTIGLKSQVSKNLLFFEPYLGIEPFVSINNYSVDYRTNTDLNAREEADEIKEILGSSTDFFLGDSRVTLTTDNQSAWGLRAFAGYSIRLYWGYWDTSIGYDMLNDTVALATSLRIQYLPNRPKRNKDK